MKIGPFEISRARNAAKGPTSAPAGELGSTGTPIFSNKLGDTDYNPDLRAPQCYDVYDTMRQSDGQVIAGLNVAKMPILRAHWEIEAASDSAQDREIAETIEADLRGMPISYAAFLRQALLMLDYGSMPFEIVWERRADGLIHLRKLAPRMPKTITDWILDDNGGLKAIVQGAIRGGAYKTATIPVEKTVLFVNELEGSNYRGRSMLRGAYKHWYYKDGHYRIDAIANERRGVGMDVGTIKPGAENKASLKASLERSLMTAHSHEKNFFVEDEENYTYRVETGGARGGSNPIMQTIEHHGLQILRAIHAEFLNMGSGSTGSLAMHKDKSAFFLMGLEATADNVAETMSSHLIRRWVDYNWRVTAYPRLKYSRLDTRDTAAIADAVNKLVSVDTLTNSPATEAEMRVLLDFPELEIDPNEAVPGMSGEVQAQALNGAQIASMLTVLQEVTRGALAPESAKAMLAAAFPTLDEGEVNRMVDSAAAFTPTAPLAPAA